MLVLGLVLVVSFNLFQHVKCIFSLVDVLGYGIFGTKEGKWNMLLGQLGLWRIDIFIKMLMSMLMYLHLLVLSILWVVWFFHIVLCSLILLPLKLLFVPLQLLLCQGRTYLRHVWHVYQMKPPCMWKEMFQNVQIRE